HNQKTKFKTFPIYHRISQHYQKCIDNNKLEAHTCALLADGLAKLISRGLPIDAVPSDIINESNTYGIKIETCHVLRSLKTS
ncbi:hypothetical protein NPIL_221021, partial [Nephila pilipes]